MATKESQNQGNSSTIKLPIGNITSSIQAYQKGGMSLPRIRETLTEKRIGERLLNQAFKALNIPLAKTQPEALPQEKRFVDQPDAEQKIKELLAEGKSELDIIPLIKSLGFNVQGLGKFFSKIAAKSSSKPVVTKSKKTPRNSGFDSGYRPSKTRDGKTVTQLVGEQRGTMPEAKPQENHDQRITAIARELKIPAVGDETKKTKQDKKLEVPATFAGTLTPSQEPKAETKVEPTKVPGNKLPKKTTDGRKVQDILIINYFKKNKDNYSINKIKKALIKSDISKAQIERVITEQVKLNNTQQKVKPETSHKAQREKMSAYINNQRENYGDNGIKNSLLKTGWTEDEISKGFSDAGPRKEAKLIEVKKDVKIGAQSPAKPEAKSEAKPTKEAQKGPAIPIEVSEADANKSIQTNDQKVASKTEEADTTITEEPIDLGNLTNAELDAKGQEIHKKEVAAKLAKETVVKAKTPTPKDNIQTTTVAPKVAPVEKEVTVKPVAEVKTETTTEVAPVEEVKIEAKPETTNVVEAPKKAKTFEEGVKAGEIDLQPSPETQKKLKELFEKEMTAEEKKAAKERKEKEKTAPTVRLKPLEKEAPAKKVDITEKEENKPVATGRLAWLRSKFGKKAVDKSGLKPVETTAPKTEVVIKPIVDGKNASTVETVEDEPNTSEILEATPIDEKTEDTSDKVAPIKKEGTDIVTPPVTEKKTATKKQAPTRAPHGAGYESHMEALTSSDNLHDGDMGDRQRPTIAKPAAKPTEVAPVEAKAIDPLDAAFAKLKKASEKPPANVAEITKALKVQLSDSEVVPVVEEAKKEVPIKDSTKNVEGKTEVEIKPEDIPSNDRPWDEDLDNEITRVDINPVEKEAEVKPTTKDIDAKKTKETTPEEKTVEPAKKVKAPRRDSHGVKYEAFIDSQIGDNEDIITKPERQRDTAPTTKDIKETTPAKETKKEVDDENETDQVVRGLLDDDAVEETPVDTETEVKAKKEAKPETNGDLEERLDKNQEIAELKQRVTEIEGREKGYISIDKVRDVVTDVVKGAINPEIYKTALLDIKTAKENVTGLDEKSLALKDKLTAVEKKLEKFDAKEYQSHIAQLKTLAKEGYVTRKEGGKITTDLQDYVQNYLTQLDDEDIKKIPVLQSMVTTFKGRAKELKDNIDQQTKALKEFEEKTGNTQTDIYDKVSNQTKAFEKETKAIYAGIKKQERVLAEFGEHILKAYQNLATNTVEKIEMVGGDLETLFDAASNETNNLADQIEGLKNKYHLAIPHKNIVAKGRKILNNLGKGPADPADPTESTGTPMQIYTAEQPSTQIKEKKTLRQYIPLVTQRSGMDGLRGRRVRK